MAGSAQAALNMRPHSFLQHVEKAGEGGDDRIGHLSTGDTVIPIEKTKGNPRIQQLLGQVFKEIGSDPKRFIVGHRDNHKNQRTGLPQFEDGSDGGSAGGDTGQSGGGGGGQSGPGDAPGGGASGGNAASANNPNTDQGPPASTGEIDAAARAQEAATMGPSSVLSGQMGQFGQPTSDINAIDNAINSMVTDPFGTLASTGINFGVGMIPGLGLVNSLSGALGGPTAGSIGVGLGRDAAAALGGTPTAGSPGGTTTGSGGTVGSGGGSDILPVDQASQDKEWLKRLGLTI